MSMREPTGNEVLSGFIIAMDRMKLPQSVQLTLLAAAGSATHDVVMGKLAELVDDDGSTQIGGEDTSGERSEASV